MPTYEYECMHCGHKFEAFQKMNDKPLGDCPKCKKPVKRLISSGIGVIFSRSWRDSAKAEKGSGFYATNYRKKPKGAKPESAIPDACPHAKKGCDGCPKAG